MERLAVDKDFYLTSIGTIKSVISQRKSLENQVQQLNASLLKQQTELVKLIRAQKLLSTVSDDNTRKTIDFVTSMVNKVLLELFPKEPYYIKMEPKLHAGTRPHLVMELYDSEGHILDTSTQSGDGIKQVICFMYVICLIEIRKARRLVIFDERLNGLHASAKKCILGIMNILTKGGFQFIMVEYGFNSVGKMYNVERKNKESYLVSLDGINYNDMLVNVEDADLSVLDDEGEEEPVED